MGQLNLGVFWGYASNSDYGKFNVLFNYTANGCTLSSMNIKLSKTVDYKYTTNSYIVDSVKVGGTSFSYSPSSGDLSGYQTKGGGPQINLTGSITVSGTSASVEIKMHRTGQSANAQVFTGTISGLATAPTGLSCSVSSSSITETSLTLSGSYSSDGGSAVTSSGYQYKIDGGSWANCGSSVTGLTPTKKYYFRYYATNVVGTTYSSEVSATMYDYPKPTTMENFLIGNGPRITLSNPLRRSVTLQILQRSTNTVLGTYSGNADGVIQSEFATASAVDSQYASIPNSKSGTYYCKVTYSNISTKTLGESSNYTYSIKEIDSEKPTFSTSNITSLTNNSSHSGLGDTNKFIKGYNSLAGSIIKMTPNKHANGDKYNISATGLSATVAYSSSSTPQTFSLGNMTTSTFTVTAVDKRGMYRTITYDLGDNFINYSKPTISGANIQRENGIGQAVIIKSLSGTYTYWPTGSSGLSKVNKIVKIRYKIDNGSYKDLPSGTTITNSGSVDNGGTWSISNVTLADTFTITTRYNLTFELTDELGNVTSSAKTISNIYQVGTADALLWRDLANKRIGIRMKPNYTLDVNGYIGQNNEQVISAKDRGNYNINNIYDTNIVSIASGSNCPSGSQHGVLLNMAYRNTNGNIRPDFAGQIFIPNGDDSSKPDSMFFRTANRDSWRSWNEVAKKSDIPTVPTVNNATLTIQKNGSTVNTFTANASSNVTANITVPTKTSELTNNSNFATTGQLPDWQGTNNNYTVRFNYQKVQIAFIRFNHTATIGNTWGNAMFTCSAFTPPAYQRAFASAPMVSVFVEGGNSAIPINSNTGTASQPPNIQLARGSKANSATYTISIIAIGYYS